MIDGEEAQGRFALVEHPMSPRALAAPMHRHLREDEYSYVLQGRIGALLGDEVLIGGPGDLIFKPRNQWHTFWNAGDEPARILEIISPAGFEKFFAELVDLGGVTRAEPQVLADLCARYGLEMDPASVPGLIERFNLRFPGEAM
jgi:mannose-6-phosphate isomerase-like protein (cupin superfamily)